MVKVIRTEPDKSVVKEAICPNCGATLEYTPRDIETYTIKDYSGSFTTYEFIKFITCPNCSKELFLT